MIDLNFEGMIKKQRVRICGLFYIVNDSDVSHTLIRKVHRHSLTIG